MHASKIFAVLVIFSLTSGFVNYRKMPDNLSAVESEKILGLSMPPKTIDSVGPVVMVKVQDEIDHLQKNLNNSKSLAAKVQMVRSSLSQIAEIRKKSGVLELDKEMYLDFMTDPLVSFFNEDYRPEKCATFEHTILRDYEPNYENNDSGREPAANPTPQNPPLKKAFDLVSAVCK